MEDIVEQMLNTVFMSYPSSALNNIITNLVNLLSPFAETLDTLDDLQKQSITKYLQQCYVDPSTPVGIMCSHSIMQGVIQSSLSSFHYATKSSIGSNVYLSMEDVLDMSSARSYCSFKPLLIDAVDLRKRLKCVYMSSLVESHTSVKEPGRIRRIKLSKKKMFECGLSMYDIEKLLSTINNRVNMSFSANYESCITISSNSIPEIHELFVEFDKTVVSGIKGIDNVEIISSRDGDRLIVDTKHAAQILCRHDVDVESFFCNDVQKTYDLFGIGKCRQLIFSSLMSDNKVREEHAMLIADYMTWKGYPCSFNKEGIENVYGPLFDMYFEKPRKTLKKWTISKNVDTLGSPYTRVMLGVCDDRDFHNFSIIDITNVSKQKHPYNARRSR